MSRSARPAALPAALLAALVLLLSGCERELPPDATYRALVRAVADGDEEGAWRLLASSTRTRLEERARTAAAAAPGVVVPSARALVAGDARRAVRPPSVITTVRSDASRTVLHVEAPGQAPREVLLLREDGRWRVDLPVQ